MKMRHAMAALAVLVGLPACDHAPPPEKKEEAPADNNDAKAPTKPAKADEAKESALSPEVEKALAALRKQELPLTKDNHERGKMCDQMRALAGASDKCNECLETYVTVLNGEADQRIVDCSAEQLPAVEKDADKLCTALVQAWKRNKYGNSRALAGFSLQGARCKGQMDDFLTVLEEKFAAYDNSYGSLGPANLIYVNRMLDHMTPEQKKKVAEAAKKLEKLAREKKDRKGKVSERTAEEAKKLATDASG